MNNAILVSADDNVVVAIEKINKGDTVNYLNKDNRPVACKALNDIPIYHKCALKNISKNEPVIKYGEHIGIALCDIQQGEHVHDFNCEGRRENLKEKE
ncbi:UxaA family hydrolase [Peptoniphilus equinus]|uniref:UxaA family hydrolase n=1 Tax=Peptoniphilus equinus TaxID=3016343 RepID=A0ABY7QSZ1_9FIRM|nr:UxaA family hydrolase [Peptoniphilus equinus]WBW49857.1 UxaA family hydrolase [Peptoniphilus equinus]